MRVMIWQRWFGAYSDRTDKVWDGEMKLIITAVQLAKEFLHQWQAARSKPNSHVQHQEQHTTRWQPPEHNYVKYNFKVESGTRLTLT